MILGSAIRPNGLEDPYKRTTNPYVTGTSVIAIKGDGFVLMAADTLASYGRMARFQDFERIAKMGDRTIFAAGGELSDFQWVTEWAEGLVRDEWLQGDGGTRGPEQWHTLLTRVCYGRRNKFDPLYNNFAVGGVKKNGTAYLGYTDHLGTYFKDNYIATGFGAHLGLPIIRNEYKQDMTLDEAKALIHKVMKVLYYRDCRCTKHYVVSEVTQTGMASQNHTVNPDWSVAPYVRGYNGQMN